MRPDKQFKKEELEAEVEEAPQVVRELEMTVEQEEAQVEDLRQQLMSAELAAQNEQEQIDNGREISEQIAEVAGS